jgi:hypothetical protein
MSQRLPIVDRRERVVTAEDDAKMGSERRREPDENFHRKGARVLKVHIRVSKCAFTV